MRPDRHRLLAGTGPPRMRLHRNDLLALVRLGHSWPPFKVVAEMLSTPPQHPDPIPPNLHTADRPASVQVLYGTNRSGLYFRYGGGGALRWPAPATS